jgi:hypothetical protein
VNSKKLKKYEKEYITIKEQEMQQEDPIERMEVGHGHTDRHTDKQTHR